MRRRYKDKSSVFDVIPILLLLGFGTILLLILLFSPQIIEFARTLELPSAEGIAPLIEIPAQPAAQNQSAAPTLTDAERLYFSLKNKSCQTLSKDFLIVTTDVSEGSLSGLSGFEEDAAKLMLRDFVANQTTKTYVRGDMMKKVIISGGAEHTTIWKDGRLYQCNPNCTMRLLGDSGWQAYLDGLERMRTGCAYFGRTAMPDSVDIGRLLDIRSTGREERGGFRCEGFLITGNSAYAESLLQSNMSLTEDQRALLWSLSHLDSPIEECIDDGVGVAVYRSITLDLTGIYRFDFAENGFMHVTQETELGYFTDSVPESFLALPK